MSKQLKLLLLASLSLNLVSCKDDSKKDFAECSMRAIEIYDPILHSNSDKKYLIQYDRTKYLITCLEAKGYEKKNSEECKAHTYADHMTNIKNCYYKTLF